MSFEDTLDGIRYAHCLQLGGKDVAVIIRANYLIVIEWKKRNKWLRDDDLVEKFSALS